MTGLVSYCGGIPAPDSNTNPWGYKFAWSPRGVLLAVRNAVRFIERGRIVQRVFPDLFDNPRTIEVAGVGPLVAYPNRDCLRYVAPYGLSEDLEEFYRGTLRYPGWCETVQALNTLGFLDLQWEGGRPPTMGEMVRRHLPDGVASLPERVARRLGITPGHPIIGRLEWLGLFSEDPLPTDADNPLEAITTRMQERLRYEPGERDLVVLRHELRARMPGGVERVTTATMVLDGPAGDDSAMARCVSSPAAIACRLVLAGEIAALGGADTGGGGTGGTGPARTGSPGAPSRHRNPGAGAGVTRRRQGFQVPLATLGTNFSIPRGGKARVRPVSALW